MDKKSAKRLARLYSKWPSQPNSVTSSLHKRSCNGVNHRVCEHLMTCFSNRRVPFLWKEKEFDLGELNKVFASQWIAHDSVVMGTKCNKLVVLDVLTGRMSHIPMIKGPTSYPPRHVEDEGSGIHSISINPGGSYLATGADNPNNLAVYEMPDFEPVCVGEECHDDWIFDIKWLDDEILVTGSRDGTLALWSVIGAFNSDLMGESSGGSIKTIKPRCKRRLQSSDGFMHEDDLFTHKVRALEFNNNRKELASVVVPTGCISFWDVRQLREFSCRKLHYGRESVCMAFSDSYSLYAVGSQSHVTILDTRKGRMVAVFSTKESCSGVRSLKFQGDILSAGTGMGAIKFIDIRQMKFLHGDSRPDLTIKVGKGWLSRDDIYFNYFSDTHYRSAIYTHSYDFSGMRLFAAGGPLPSGLTGNYAGLFH